MAENHIIDNFMYTDPNDPNVGNRANDTRRDNDTFTTPSIDLYDIDYSILYHLKHNLDFQIEENDKMIPVPVVFASGEMWNQIQRHGYMRDRTRKMMTPAIVLKRNSIAHDDRFTFLKTVGPNDNRLIISPDRQNHDVYDWTTKSYNTKRNQQWFISVLPNFIIVTYDVYIWTQLTVQMNSIVESLLAQDSMLWGDAFKFVTDISDFSFETIAETGDDRIIRSQCTLTVKGRLVPEYILKNSTLQKAYSLKRIDFINEVEQPEIYVTPPKIIRSGRSRLPLRELK